MNQRGKIVLRACAVLAAVVALSAARPAAAVQVMTYRNGPVLSPRIACLLWGSWTSTEKSDIENYLTGLQRWMSNEHMTGGVEPPYRQYGVWGAYFPGPCALDSVIPSGVTVDLNSSTFKNQLQTEIARAQNPANHINLEGYTAESVFLVFTKGVPTASTFGAGSWCAFHNSFAAGQYYGVIPQQTGTCGGTDATAALQTMASHELFEAATNGDLSTGWYGTDAGNEVGDGCPGQLVSLPNGIVGTVSQVVDNNTQSCQNFAPAEVLPAAVVKTGTTINVFAQDSNGGLQQISGDGVNWGAPQARGGVIPDAPTAISIDGVTIDVYSRGLDGGLWHWSFDGSNWSGPSSLGGFIIGPPSASYKVSRGRLVYARGTDGNIWVNTEGAWQVAGTLPGGVLAISPPQAFQRSNDCVDIYTTGTNGHLYQQQNCSDLPFWTDQGGIVLNRVSEATRASNSSRIDVFVNGPMGSPGAIPFHKSFNPNSGFLNLGGLLVGAASAVPLGSSAIRIFARGSGGTGGGQLFHNIAPTGSDFGGWGLLDSTSISDAPLAFTPDNTKVNIFMRRQDGELVQKGFDGNNYQSIQDLNLRIR